MPQSMISPDMFRAMALSKASSNHKKVTYEKTII